MGACFGNQHRKVIIIEMGPDEEKWSIKEKINKLGELDSGKFDKELMNICEKVKENKKYMEVDYVNLNDTKQFSSEYFDKLHQISEIGKSEESSSNLLPNLNEVIDNFKNCNTENKSYCR